VFSVNTAYMQYTGKRDEYLQLICNKYLSNWKMYITTNILKQLFFNNYNQAYNSIKRMHKLKLLRSTNIKNYYIATKK